MTTAAKPNAIETVAGRAIPLRGDDIDTDRIVPARYLRCVTFDGLEEHVFGDDRKQLGGRHPFDDPRFRGAAVLVVSRNFGCGSSREHAPQGLQRWGIRAIVGESFAEIFFGNCVSLGVPCVTLSEGEVQEIQAAVEADPEAEVRIDLRAREVRLRSAREPVRSKAYRASLPDGPRQSFLGGTWDATGLLLQDPARIRAVAAALPYTRGFA
ncbi:MAG: 3-isopropylmalate dehydratase small subunit [Planctomycetes bacterium]|nr:3-isopropylmalate dehydratase small subunit [Planctomycetota bacterium]